VRALRHLHLPLLRPKSYSDLFGIRGVGQINKPEENRKTVQGILGHSRIHTTLELYTGEDLDEMIAAQEKYLEDVGLESGSVR
jgi:hypothetical protein